jgi:DNA-binding MarR family transcriptional regulator
VTAKKQTSHIDEITEQWRRERPDLDLSKLLLAVYLQRLGRMIDQDFERYCLDQYKMRASDMRILLALRRMRAPHAQRPTDLFRSLLVTSGAVTKQVDRLEKRKLVKRLPDPSYAGGFLVQLTEPGRKIVDQVVDALAEGSAVTPSVWDGTRQEREGALRFCYRAISQIEGDTPVNGHAPRADRGNRRHGATKRKGGAAKADLTEPSPP